MKLWGGRFNKPTNTLVEEYTASISFDQILAEVDIQGSIAHVKMLAKGGFLTKDEADQLITGLQVVLEKIVSQNVEFTIADEDIHMNIERLLYAEIGELAGKLHTGRSRNDQVALDLHLFLREEVKTIIDEIVALKKALIQQAEKNIDVIMPGYTHLQRAQPIRFAQHLLAYVAMLDRDQQRLNDNLKRIDCCPLGAGALSGCGFAIDREYVAQELGFENLYHNSMDAVSDRDFVLEFLSNASMIMLHLSRLSEELILWQSSEFNFIDLDDAFCTGSSMMPQKKNPDVPELARGKTGRVFGNLFAMLTTLKGLPLTYNKDMQEDKEPVFDTLTTLHTTLKIFTPMIETMKINAKTMLKACDNDFGLATEIADHLALKGMPFREAHAVAGKIVADCIKNSKTFADLSTQDMQNYSDLFSKDCLEVLDVETAVERRKLIGGTAKSAVQAQIDRYSK